MVNHPAASYQPSDTAAPTPRLAWRRFFATNFLLRCPACGRGKVSRGLFEIKDRCGHCGARYTRFAGNFLISSTLNYFFALLIAGVAAFALFTRYGFFQGGAAVVAGVAVLAVLLLFRPMRVLTLWLLWVLGFVYPD